MRDRFASWLIGLPITWWLAEHGFKSCHLLPLCIARAVGVPVRWRHLTGRAGIMDAEPGDRVPAGGRQHD
jgi:hypothetical protein